MVTSEDTLFRNVKKMLYGQRISIKYFDQRKQVMTLFLKHLSDCYVCREVLLFFHL